MPGTSQPGPEAETLRGRSLRSVGKKVSGDRRIRLVTLSPEDGWWCARCGELIRDGSPFFCLQCRRNARPGARGRDLRMLEGE